LDTPVVGPPGKFFKLCWGHEPADKTDYKFMVTNTATLAGPFLTNFECTLGMPCRVTLRGIDLQVTNAIRLITGRCDDTPYHYNATREINGTPANASDPRQRDGQIYYNETNPNHVNLTRCFNISGVYFCNNTYIEHYVGFHPGFTLANWTRSSWLQNIAEIGQLASPGPAPVRRLDLTPLPTPSLLTFEEYWPNDFTAGMGELVSFGRGGAIFSTTNAALEVDEEVDEAVFSFSTPIVGAAGDGYTLCWSHDPVLAWPLVIADHRASLAGPAVQHRRCVLGDFCTIQLRGHRFSKTSAVAVIYNDKH
jgi:hypothetical protein